MLGGLAACTPLADPPAAPKAGDQESARLLVAPQDPAPVLSPAPPPVSERGSEKVILRGTGRRVGSGATDPVGWHTDPGGGLQLNFKEAPVRDIAAAILGDALNLDYTVDERIDGTLTLKTNRPVPKEALLSIYETSHDANDIALVRRRGLYVVKTREGGRDGAVPALEIEDADLSAGFGVQVVPLRHVSARRLAETLRPFAPDDGAWIRIDADSNLLILSGTGPERASLLDMVDVFDVDWMAGLSYALFPLEAAEAGIVVRELKSIFANDEDGLGAGTVRFQPVERLNAVLVIANEARAIARTERWIARLDSTGHEADE
ncbi:MAG: secretin N-terminal domain-containing protein, partial [Sandaracinaceae bacterium]